MVIRMFALFILVNGVRLDRAAFLLCFGLLSVDLHAVLGNAILGNLLGSHAALARCLPALAAWQRISQSVHCPFDPPCFLVDVGDPVGGVVLHAAAHEMDFHGFVQDVVRPIVFLQVLVNPDFILGNELPSESVAGFHEVHVVLDLHFVAVHLPNRHASDHTQRVGFVLECGNLHLERLDEFGRDFLLRGVLGDGRLLGKMMAVPLLALPAILLRRLAVVLR